MSRGRIPGSGSAQARILATLRALGTDKEGRPLALHAAELAARAKVNHHSLAKCTGALLELGQITRCLIQPAKGPKTYEFRIGPGLPAPEFKPLNARRAGAAAGKHRSSTGPLPPLPKTTPAPATPRGPGRAAHAATQSAAAGTADADLLRRVQNMDERQFGDFVAHLARVWGWGRGRQMQGGGRDV